jgi:AraC-like DNA-binding protein
VLVLVRNGLVIFRHGGSVHVVQAGESALITPGNYDMEAVPAVSRGAIDFEYGAFPIALLREIFGNAHQIEAFVLGFSKVEDCGVHVERNSVAPIDNVLRQNLTFSQGTESCVKFVIHSGSLPALLFARFGFYEKQWALEALLESHIGHKLPVSVIEQGYATGPATFQRDCHDYLGLAPGKWYHRRRMELARNWIEHSTAAPSAVAATLGYENCEQFAADYKKHHRLTVEKSANAAPWEKLENAIMTACLRPFWWPSPLPLLSADGELCFSSNEKDDHHDPEQADEAAVQESASAAESFREKICPEFWALRPGVIRNVIPFPASLPRLMAAA